VRANTRAMGFLSRKNKSASTQTVEEQHPIVEELQDMEEAVPERPEPAGPIASDTASTTPPAGEAS
jgi:hypothetical protein